MRVTQRTPWEMALQLVSERLATALADCSDAEMVAVLFVKLPSAQAEIDQATRELVGNRGVVQEYLSGRHAHTVAEMEVGSPDL